MPENNFSNTVWLNLPVKDLQKAKSFYAALGFNINIHETDKMVSVSAGTNKLIINLCSEPTFESAASASIANTEESGEVLISIGANSAKAVDDLVETAKQAGGKIFAAGDWKDGWMYGAGFSDPDGHRWNALYMDMAKMPKN